VYIAVLFTSRLNCREKKRLFKKLLRKKQSGTAFLPPLDGVPWCLCGIGHGRK
jgi:hypothetical protein